MSPLFDKYTDRAKRVLMFAQDESRRLNHDYIGTEHLLLGLVREEKGTAAKILSSMGVDHAKARDAVESIAKRGKHSVLGDISLTQRGKKVIEHAAEESRLMGTQIQRHRALAFGSRARQQEHRRKGPHRHGGEPSEGAQRRSVHRWSREHAKEGMLSLTTGAQKAIGLATDEARRLGHSEVGTGHLLLGLAREGEGLAAGELQGLGVDLQRVRRQLDKRSAKEKPRESPVRQIYGSSEAGSHACAGRGAPLQP